MDTGTATDGELRAMLDQFAVGQLQARYSDAVTRRSWDEVAELFAADCAVHLDLGDATTRTLSGGQAVAAMIAAGIERFEFFEVGLLNAVVELGPDAGEASGRLYLWELRQERDTGRWSNAYGLYRDRYRRIDGAWRFAERRYSSLARTAPDGDAMVVFPIPGK